MRIADKMQFEQVKSNLSKNRSEMSILQNQAATQKRVTKPSDDPVAATRVLANRSDIQGAEQFIKNGNAAKSHLELSEQALGEITDALVRAKELALSQANDAGANQTSREVTATEIKQLHDQAVQVANRKFGERFLFGGYRTTRPPFDTDGQYHGDGGEIQIQVNKDAFIAMNLPGNKVFYGEGLLRPEEQPQSGKPMPAVNESSVQIRGPAALENGQVESTESVNPSDTWNSKGVDIFRVLKDLQIALQTDHKAGIQDSLDQLDSAIEQIVLARSELGSRITTVDNNVNSLQKSNVDTKASTSQLEDADTFALVSDISKTQNTLQATLSTSGKLIQPSLLDFLK